MLFEREILSQEFLKVQMWPLLERHYKEISADQDIPLKPDFQSYLHMEQAGTLRCFVVRDETDGMALVGYAVFFVHRALHYQTSLQAVQDVLYLEKSSRGAGVGQTFVDWCDQELKREGVQKVIQHVKVYMDFGPMLKKLGYRHVENIWCRRLDGG